MHIRFCNLSNNPKEQLGVPVHDNSITYMTYSRFIEIQSNLRRKKLHRINQGSNFLGSSFSNRDNAKAPTQFRRENQQQHLKRLFFKNRPIHSAHPTLPHPTPPPFCWGWGVEPPTKFSKRVD